MKKLLANRWVSLGLWTAMLLVLAICLLRPNQWELLRIIARYSLHLMFLYLVAAIGFLVYGQRRLLFTALACCATLALVLKVKADASIQMISTTSQPMIHVVQTSISSVSEDWNASFNAINSARADIVTFLEVTPTWKNVLDSYFLEAYPFAAANVRIDDLGVAIYSREKISSIDTLDAGGLPSLMVEMDMDALPIHVIVSNTFPPLFNQSFQELRQQLMSIGAVASSNSDIAVLTIGDYNLDQFSDELQDFRAQGKLKDSRKTMTPSFSPPTNHIFYNEMLEFQHFSNLYDANSNRLGIQGTYQYSNEAFVAKRNR